MTTNNHPAHDPVSLDRLHQIREHLQHDTQYSNGGNRAYILADVLKIIDGAIAAFGAEPVARPKCNDTGMADSGGVQPWGEPILIECDCRAAMLQVGNSPVVPDCWIPVSERMPEGSEEVLCTKEFDGPGDWRKKVGYWLAGKWTVYGASWTPTHWMPLPAAPKQEVKCE